LRKYHPYIFHPNAGHFNGQKELWGKPHTSLVVDIVRSARKTKEWIVVSNALGAKGCPS
jgi:hypothetical protein